MGFDWPTPQEAIQQRHQTGSDLESTGKEKEAKIAEHMRQRKRDRNAEKRSPFEGAGEDSPEYGALVECRRWPMLLTGLKAQVSS